MQKICCFLIAAALLFGGCASDGVVSGGLKYPDYNKTMAPLAPDRGRIIFYRKAFFLGSPLQPEIRFNGDSIGQSVAGAFFYKDVAAGEHVVSTSSEPERDLKFTISAKQVLFVRTGVSLESLLGRVNASLVPSEEAESDLFDLRYLQNVPEVVRPVSKQEPTVVAPPRDEGY